MADRIPILRIAVVSLFALTEMLSSARMVLAGPSTVGFDVDPPLIEHDVREEVEADTWQVFSATVVDDEELDRVRLFYRFAGESAYSSLVMNRVSFSSTWTIRVPTEPDDIRAVEYYIEALDQSGNRTIHGYPFSPLVRHIVESPNKDAANDADETAGSTAADIAADKKAASRRKGLYYLAGAAAVALIAGLARSGGSGEGCTDNSCEITFTVERPY